MLSKFKFKFKRSLGPPRRKEKLSFKKKKVLPVVYFSKTIEAGFSGNLRKEVLVLRILIEEKL